MSMKNSNRTLDPLTCSTLPEQTASTRTPGNCKYWNNIRVNQILLCSLLVFIREFLGIKGKAVPLQAWSGPEGSNKLRFPYYMTKAQDGGKVVSPTHQPPLPQEIFLVLISVRV